MHKAELEDVRISFNLKCIREKCKSRGKLSRMATKWKEGEGRDGREGERGEGRWSEKGGGGGGGEWRKE